MKIQKLIIFFIAFMLLIAGCDNSGAGGGSSAGDSNEPGMTDAEAVSADTASLTESDIIFSGSGDGPDYVTDDFTMPLTGENGTTISWEVDEISVVNITGGSADVTRSLTGDVAVGLTATIKKGTAESTKSFPLTVIRRPVIFMFAMSGTNGDIGSRAEADAACLAAYNAGYPDKNCNNVHALLSFSTNDEIRDMPSLYSVPTGIPVVSMNGTEIASNWQSIVNARNYPLTNSLADAGVTSDSYWTGSFENGMSPGNGDCSGWTSSSSGGVVGQLGDSSATNQSFLQYAISHCHSARPYLAICWQD